MTLFHSRKQYEVLQTTMYLTNRSSSWIRVRKDNGPRAGLAWRALVGIRQAVFLADNPHSTKMATPLMVTCWCEIENISVSHKVLQFSASSCVFCYIYTNMCHVAMILDVGPRCCLHGTKLILCWHMHYFFSCCICCDRFPKKNYPASMGHVAYGDLFAIWTCSKCCNILTQFLRATLGAKCCAYVLRKCCIKFDVLTALEMADRSMISTILATRYAWAI